MSAFVKIPFLRILLPFILGIGWSLMFPDASVRTILLPAILCLLLLLLNRLFKRGEYAKYFYLLGADLFLLLLGSYLTFQQNDSNHKTHYTRRLGTDSVHTLVVQVADLPTKKDKFTRIPARILAHKESGRFETITGQTIVYLKNSGVSALLRPGDRFVLHARFTEVRGPQNPEEFDYKRYLSYRNIYHTLFVDSACIYRIPPTPKSYSLWDFGLTCKDALLSTLRKSGLSSEAFSICSALLTGYDDEIDRSIMEAFSHSGTLHVLSVSGLHVGLIYLVIDFFMQKIDPRNKQKLLRFLITCLALWFFALVTGFSSPVLRATLMFTLLGFGKIYFRAQRSNQLNILLVSAFILLLVNPFYLMDVGFLLSYFALFGLIYFQPAFVKLWNPKDRKLSYLWESSCASFAATLSTLPVTLFFFKQFPLWFFLCNMVVVPATFLLMGLGALILCHCLFLVPLANGLVKLLIGFIELFNSGAGYIDQIDFNASDALWLSLFLFFLSIAFQYHAYAYLRNALATLIVWQVLSIGNSYQAKTSVSFSFYKIKGEEVYLFKAGQNVYISPFNLDNFKRHVQPHVTSFNYPRIHPLKFNYIRWKDESILVFNRKTLQSSADRSAVRTLLITGNYRLSEQDLMTYKKVKRLVVGSDNSLKTAKHTEELSRNFKLDFYSVNESGCWQLSLN